MKQINDSVLDLLIKQAQVSPRHRAHSNLHPNLEDPVQRLSIAMEPSTFVRPHRHSDPETWEVLLILRGSMALLIFDDKGEVVERTVLSVGGPITAIEIQQNTWHAPVSLESGTVVFEVKRGPYKPIAETNYASWAPAESMPEAASYLEWYRHAKVGEEPPVERS